LSLLIRSRCYQPLFSFPTRRSSDLQHFDPDLLNYNRAIWHGIVGSYFIEKELKITDPEILTAIKRHTTADVEMTTLDKISGSVIDRKSTRLNSSHVSISYAVFCLKK